MNTETANTAWIGQRPSNLEIFAVMFVGVAGIMIAGLQPLLLETLGHEGKLTPNQLGQAGAAELLTLGLAAFVAGAVLKTVRLKAISIFTALILVALDAVTPFFSGDAITLIRALAGIPSGVLMWVAIAMIARTRTPERWSGIYLTVQTLAQFLMATLLAVTVVPIFGAGGGWVAMAVFCGVTAIVALFVPDRLGALPREAGHSALPGIRGWIALLAAFLYSGFTICVWVYAGPLSTQSGHDPSVIGTAVSVSLACQVLGGGAATLLAGRVNWLWTVMVSAALALAVLFGFYALPSPEMFLVLSGIFGFLWLFVLPFLVPMVIEADPTRRAAVLIGGAQVLGGSFGPFVASLLVTTTDSRNAITFGGACMIAAILLALGLHQIRSRKIALEGMG